MQLKTAYDYTATTQQLLRLQLQQNNTLATRASTLPEILHANSSFPKATSPKVYHAGPPALKPDASLPHGRAAFVALQQAHMQRGSHAHLRRQTCHGAHMVR